MKNNLRTIMMLVAVAAVMLPGMAYAQTNTDRLITIVDEVEDVSESVDGVSGQVTAVNDVVEMIYNTVNSLVNAFDEFTADVGEKLDMIGSDVTATSNTVNSIDSKINNVDAILMQIAENVNMQSKNVYTLDSINDGVGMVYEGQMGLSDSVDELSLTTNTGILMIEDRLASLEAKIDMLLPAEEEMADDDSTMKKLISSTTGLLENVEKQTITSYNYKAAGEMFTRNSLPAYELDVVFSCDTDVFVDTVSITKAHPDKEYLDRTSSTDRASVVGVNTIAVEKRGDVFNNKFSTGNLYIEFLRSLDLGTRLLSVDDQLTLNTVIYDGQFTNTGALSTTDDALPYLIKNSTRDMNTDLYLVSVEYLTEYVDTECSVGALNVDNTVLDTSKVITYPATGSGSADGVIRTYMDTITCNDVPALVTDVSTNFHSNHEGTFYDFNTVKLTVIDGENDNSPDATLKDSENGLVLMDGALPELSAGDSLFVEVEGVAEAVLVTIKYDTVKGGSCSE